MTAVSLQTLMRGWAGAPDSAADIAGAPRLPGRVIRPSMPAKTPPTQPATAKTGPRIRPVPAVTRSVAILRTLAQAKEPMNAQSIARKLNIVPSTCLHILRALTAERLLSFEIATKRYKLGVGMLALARGVQENNTFVQAVQPVLDALAHKWAITAIGVEVMELDSMIVAALSRSRLPFRLHVDVGSRFPALISATGRLVAAYGDHPPEQIREQFDALRWQQPLPYEDWLAQVRTARAQGYSMDTGNYIAGIALIAVPVLDTFQRITHTLVAAGIADQLPPDRMALLVDELKAHAAELSRHLYALG